MSLENNRADSSIDRLGNLGRGMQWRHTFQVVDVLVRPASAHDPSFRSFPNPKVKKKQKVPDKSRCRTL
jgi:hypothetical protein